MNSEIFLGIGKLAYTDSILAMPITDTTPEAQAMQFKILGAMTGEQRVLRAFEMSFLVRALARARIVEEHPEWCEAQVMRELLRLAFLPNPLTPQFKAGISS